MSGSELKQTGTWTKRGLFGPTSLKSTVNKCSSTCCGHTSGTDLQTENQTDRWTDGGDTKTKALYQKETTVSIPEPAACVHT